MNMLTTDCSIDAITTGKTDKTDFVSNEEFLCVVFGNNFSDARPLLVSFEGNPASAPSKAWFGKPWLGMIDLPTNANNYFSLAVFRPDEAGQYRRQKARFFSLYAVMLDDVGSKVEMSRLTLPPSWLLETSEGNYQAGYLLNEPLSDGLAADRLMNAIVDAGLCDPGANGPRARLARLPVAINGKHTPSFQCRLAEWMPDHRYSIEELTHGLQLDMMGSGRPKRPDVKYKPEKYYEDDSVWIPRPQENIVVTLLCNQGLYKAPLGEGKHDISCPWLNEHTDRVNSATAYFEPDDQWPIGGFKCLHGHCADRHIRDLLRFLDIEPNLARMKPTIRVIAGEIHRVVDAAERELAHSSRFYQRGGLIVTVTTDPGTRDTKVCEITQSALVRALADAAIWERYDARAQNWVRTDPPARHAAVLFDSTAYPHLPVLNGLARQPYLRPDGSLMTTAGYDVATGMFGVFDARAFSVTIKPTRADAEVALDKLRNLLCEFSFANPSDEAAALCAILTASIRANLPTAPMFHVMAHMVGSGKSYLCELITAFATPQRGTPTTFPTDDEECRKLLLAELLRAPAVIEFDNLTSDLVPHKSLCTALTSEFMSGRILGVSKTATVSTRTLLLSSGNNVRPVQDMTRRCVTIRLSPQCETPAARDFKHPDLVREVLHERGRFVSLALTIICAWMAAGRPKTTCKGLPSYGDWSELCRQPLLWLGCADPTVSVFESMAEDPDRETLIRLLKAWFEAFRTSPAMVREVVTQANAYGEEATELKEVLYDIAGERGEINRRKLGWWIRRHAGRIADGMCIVRATSNGSAEKWQIKLVEPVSQVSAVFCEPTEKTVSNDSDIYYRASRGQ